MLPACLCQANVDVRSSCAYIACLYMSIVSMLCDVDSLTWIYVDMSHTIWNSLTDTTVFNLVISLKAESGYVHVNVVTVL